MSNNRPKERLAPPLMWVFRASAEARDAKKPLDLRDEAGERVIANRRTAVRSAIAEPVLRREVARDLTQLMNTINLASTEDLSEFPEVRDSILNFGFPELASRTIDEARVMQFTDEIRRALISFEPRLEARSIAVRHDPTIPDAELKVRFVVRADLKCEPLNVPVEFVADVEFDTGSVRIDRM